MTMIRLVDKDELLTAVEESTDTNSTKQDVRTSDVEDYLTDVLITGIGVTKVYNPLACPSGILNKLVSTHKFMTSILMKSWTVVAIHKYKLQTCQNSYY